MKRKLIALLITGLLLIAGHALADASQFCDVIPQEVQTLETQFTPEGDLLDCIVVPGTPIGDFCFVLSPSHLNGYVRQNGLWTLHTQTSSPFEPIPGKQVFFRRHTPGAAPGVQGTCGLLYPDAAGLDIIQADQNAPDTIFKMMQFHWQEGQFRVIGWHTADPSQFTLRQDGQWRFFDSLSGKPLESVRMDPLWQHGFLIRFSDLPASADEAKRMEAIDLQTAETLYPGWTLTFYEVYNAGRDALAGYYKVANGMLSIRRVLLHSDSPAVPADTIPVPLSSSLLARLQTEDPAALIDTSGYGNTFLTQDALDANAIPITGALRSSDLQTHGLVLLTEDADGLQRIQWAEPNGSGFSIQSSQVLPPGTSLDLYHTDNDQISLQIGTLHIQCSFRYTSNAIWALNSIVNTDANATVILRPRYGGISVSQETDPESEAQLYIGTYAWYDLFTIDFSQFPPQAAAVIASVNRDGWAAVCNPDPSDRLHLRSAPSREAESLGKFYNHTPVQVLTQQGDWSQVRIGLDGNLQGWMMTRYLAFGTAMDAIESAFRFDLTIREAYTDQSLYTAPSLREITGICVTRDTWIIGVVEDTLFILLDAQGHTGYMPQSWFWPGNG